MTSLTNYVLTPIATIIRLFIDTLLWLRQKFFQQLLNNSWNVSTTFSRHCVKYRLSNTFIRHILTKLTKASDRLCWYSHVLIKVVKSGDCEVVMAGMWCNFTLDATLTLIAHFLGGNREHSRPDFVHAHRSTKRKRDGEFIFHFIIMRKMYWYQQESID